MTWDDFFKEEQTKDYYKELMKKVDDAYSSSIVFPDKEKIYYAFSLTPLEDLKVVILGQDPYLVVASRSVSEILRSILSLSLFSKGAFCK